MTTALANNIVPMGESQADNSRMTYHFLTGEGRSARQIRVNIWQDAQKVSQMKANGCEREALTAYTILSQARNVAVLLTTYGHAERRTRHVAVVMLTAAAYTDLEKLAGCYLSPLKAGS